MIVFRGQQEYDSTKPLEAEEPERPHCIEYMRRHINCNGVEGGDPYISLTNSIAVAAMKFAYGNKATKNKEYRLNNPIGKKRGVVLMMDLDSTNSVEPPIDQTAKNGMVSYYSIDNILKEIPALKLKGFAAADREVLVYSRIPKEQVFEVHPFLVDLLIVLDYYKSQKHFKFGWMFAALYDTITEKIKNGQYTVENISNMLKTLNLNKLEREFIEKYYGERLNMEATYDSIINYKDNISTEEKLLIGTALRVQVLKDLFPLFMEKDGVKFPTSLIEDFSLPIEEDISTTSKTAIELDNSTYKYYDNLVIDFKNDKSKGYESKEKKIPFGATFAMDDNGNLARFTTIYTVVRKNDIFSKPEVQNSKREIKVLTPDVSNYVGIDLLNNEDARAQRENEINDRTERKNARKNPYNELEYWFFDKDGYCIICRIEVSKDVEQEDKYRIIDFLRDDNGKRTKFDGLGFDRDGFDKDGFDRNGLDRDGFDRIDCRKSGIPRTLDITQLSKLQSNEIDEEIRKSMKRFFSYEGKEKISSISPLERLIKNIVIASISGSTITKEEKREYCEEEFYNSIMFSVYGKNFRGTDIDKRILDKLIRSSLRVSKEYDIDVEKIFSQVINEKIISKKEKIRETEEILKETTSKLEGKGISVSELRKLQKKASNMRDKMQSISQERPISSMEFDGLKKKFEEKYGDGRD